ncbi:MAG: SGNH/GDSL hydrolase family protein [Methylacidiphilales bacterium]|nr:SGNH/GDSL hydrolase family protein [Candidatus Methylacidiphilales bacterium]
MGRLKDVLVNLALSAAALVFVLLVFELIVFRFVLPGSDLPRNAFVDDVIRYAPNQQGVWRVRNDIAAPFAINAQGWNSGTGDYELPRSQGTMRIAFVGDSYVEALQVPHDASLAEHVARTGAAQNQRIETYRFAISGAPMSQYLHIVEREVVKYRPDWIVVLLVGNDYDESFVFQPGRYTSAFRKLRVAGGEVTGEIPPTPWEPGWADTLRQLATVRFFQFRWQVRPETLAAWVVASGRADTPTPDLLGPRRPISPPPPATPTT